MQNVRFRHSFIILANLLVALMLLLTFSKSLDAAGETPDAVLGQAQTRYMAPSYDSTLLLSVADQINATRAKDGLGKLSQSAELDAIAQQRASDMAKNSYYSHKAADGSDFSKLLKDSGYGYNLACENLNMSATPSANVYVQTWLSSNLGHRECMLGETYTKAGYAVATIKSMADIDIDQQVIVAIYSN
jgi:uncharacterized protein YkwD